MNSRSTRLLSLELFPDANNVRHKSTNDLWRGLLGVMSATLPPEGPDRGCARETIPGPTDYGSPGDG